MSTGVMITLIICVTIILLFGTIMTAAVLSKNKQERNDDSKENYWRK